jgi:hypothetical protein
MSFNLFISIVIWALCISNCSYSSRSPVSKLNSNCQNYSDKTLISVCQRLAAHRDSFGSSLNKDIPNEILLKNKTGHTVTELFEIVRCYRIRIGDDETFFKCTKFLFFFSDGEYAGLHDLYFPDLTRIYREEGYNWLLTS